MRPTEWKKEQIEFLIETYKNESCLYVINHRSYGKKHLKNEAFRRISSKMCTIRPRSGIKECRAKLHQLRTLFSIENAKVRKARKDGIGREKVYTPNLWYYESLKFLEMYIVPQKNLSSLKLNTSADSKQIEEFSQEELSNFEETYVDDKFINVYESTEVDMNKLKGISDTLIRTILESHATERNPQSITGICADIRDVCAADNGGPTNANSTTRSRKPRGQNAILDIINPLTGKNIIDEIYKDNKIMQGQNPILDIINPLTGKNINDEIYKDNETMQDGESSNRNEMPQPQDNVTEAITDFATRVAIKELNDLASTISPSVFDTIIVDKPSKTATAVHNIASTPDSSVSSARASPIPTMASSDVCSEGRVPASSAHIPKKHKMQNNDAYLSAMQSIALSLETLTNNTTLKEDPVDDCMCFIGSLIKNFRSSQLKLDIMNILIRTVTVGSAIDLERNENM